MMPVYTLHPRKVKHSRYWKRRQEEMERMRPGVLSATRPRSDRPMWLDYYPWAPGTVPEKMVFAELARRGVTFFFGPYWGDMPFTETVYEHYRPDFILPEYRIVIEVYGAYWHTQDGSAKRDARKAMMYEAAGYHYYFLWDYDIFDSVHEAVDRIPELVNPSICTNKIYVSDRPFDPSAALRTRGRRVPKVERTTYLSYNRTKRTALPLSVQLPRLRPPRREAPSAAPGFGGLDTEYLQQIRAYSQEWKGYVAELGVFFKKYGWRAQKAYRDLYDYYLKWKDWWDIWQKATRTSIEWGQYILQLGEYFKEYPSAMGYYPTEYYQWLLWRRKAYRRR